MRDDAKRAGGRWRLNKSGSIVWTPVKYSGKTPALRQTDIMYNDLRSDSNYIVKNKSFTLSTSDPVFDFHQYGQGVPTRLILKETNQITNHIRSLLVKHLKSSNK
jgi:hypothetical protein